MICANCNQEMKVVNYKSQSKMNLETDALETTTLNWYICESCEKEEVSQFLTYEVTDKNRNYLKDLFKIWI